jgi:membrane associated rhomboid family serine protease
MDTSGLITLLIIVANFIVSYTGFKNHAFFAKYSFEVEKILVYKDYKRLITSGFLHVNWMHLAFNMISLYFFSGSIESYLGGIKFLLIYFASLLGGNIFSLIIHKNHGDYSAVGASGAVGGVIFASIALFPGMQIGLFGVLFIPAWLYGLIYILSSIYGIRSRSDNIGHEAHLAGALTGMIIAILMQPTSLIDNYITILLIVVPSIVFIFFILNRPGALLIDNHYYKNHHFYSIDHKYNEQKHSEQKEIDQILEKIHKKGMNSLTKKEREKLKAYSRSG